MGEVHRLLETKGKLAAVESGLVARDVVEAAALYMSDEDNALAFAYSGWAQLALPHRRIAPDRLWEVASDKVRLVVEPGRRATGAAGDGPFEFVWDPFGAYARLILLFLQTEALRTNSREVELGRGSGASGWAASAFPGVGHRARLCGSRPSCCRAAG